MKRLIFALVLALAACQPVVPVKADIPIAPSVVAPAPGSPPPIAAPIQEQAPPAKVEGLVVYATCEDALFNPDYGVFKDEGGFQDSKYDTGNFYHGENCGGTKYGIACGFNMEFFKRLGITPKELTKKQAADRYDQNECQAIHIGKLKGKRNPAMLLGLAVNQGSGTAIINLKLVRNAFRRIESLPPLPVNAVMDADLIDWYNSFTADDDRRLGVLFAMSLLAIDRSTDIVEDNPRQAANLMEWVTRWNPLDFRMPSKIKKAAEGRVK